MIILIFAMGSMASSLVWFNNMRLLKKDTYNCWFLPIMFFDESLWFVVSLFVAVISIISLFTGGLIEPNFSQFVFMAANIVLIPMDCICRSLQEPLSWIVTGCVAFRFAWKLYLIFKTYSAAKAYMVIVIVCFIFFTYMPFSLFGHIFWSGWE